MGWGDFNPVGIAQRAASGVAGAARATAADIAGAAKATASTIAGGSTGAAGMTRRGVQGMADDINKAFTVGKRLPAASRVFVGDLAKNVEQEANAPGSTTQAYAHTPLLGLGYVLPKPAQKVAGYLAPSLAHVASDVKAEVKHPGVGNTLAAANDVFQIATLPAVVGAAAKAATLGRAAAEGALAARGMSLAGEEGARPVLRTAGELAMKKGAGQFAPKTVGIGVDAATKAIEAAAAKGAEAVGPKVAETVAEPAIKATAAEAAKTTAKAATQEAAPAAETAAKRGLLGKARTAANFLNPVQNAIGAPEEAVRAVKSLGGIKKAPIEATMEFGGHLTKAVAKGMLVAGEASGLQQLRGKNTVLGAAVRAVTSNRFAPVKTPASGASAATPDLNAVVPNTGGLTRAQYNKILTGIHAHPEEQKAFENVEMKYGKAGLTALVKGQASAAAREKFFNARNKKLGMPSLSQPQEQDLLKYYVGQAFKVLPPSRPLQSKLANPLK